MILHGRIPILMIKRVITEKSKRALCRSGSLKLLGVRDARSNEQNFDSHSNPEFLNFRLSGIGSAEHKSSVTTKPVASHIIITVSFVERRKATAILQGDDRFCRQLGLSLENNRSSADCRADRRLACLRMSLLLGKISLEKKVL